ncbi:MAG TPA: hypothetical protein VKZ67_09075 [Natronosporangium sp.]|nr:hypothetical protein [Natronosporangium sp.]
MSSLRKLMTAASVTAVATTLALSPAASASADVGASPSGAAPPTVTENTTWRVRQVDSIGAAVEFSFDARDLRFEVAGVHPLGSTPDGDTVTDASFTVEPAAPSDATGIQQVGDYTCVVQGNPDEYFFPLEPFHVSGQGNSWFLSYTYHPYLKWDARMVSGRWTDQLEVCATGGGHTWNGWRQNFQGTAVLLGTPTNYRIGNSWGQGVAPATGLVEASLNFQLSVGVLGIGGSVKVQPTGDTYTGNVGPENRLGDPPNTSWNINRVNAFYAAPSNFIWDGSPDFQGNVAQVLYEWYWDEPPAASIWGMANVWAHCGRSLGLCDDFN